jgi:hypothetical protein
MIHDAGPSGISIGSNLERKSSYLISTLLNQIDLAASLASFQSAGFDTLKFELKNSCLLGLYFSLFEA